MDSRFAWICIAIYFASAVQANNSTSSCDEKVSTLSAEKECVGLVDKPCVNGKCVKNAECMDLCDNYDYKTNKTIDHEICWKECLCPKGLGYVESAGGLCHAPFGSTCSSSDTCIPGMVCLEGKCGCDEKTSVYSADKKTCLGKVNQPCINEHCVANAECSFLCDNYDPTSNRTGVRVNEDLCWNECICMEGQGFILEKDGSCKSPLGIACENADTCISGMKCIEGKCGCDETETRWDSIHGRCVGLADHLCVDKEHCVQNADCQYLCDNFDPKTNMTTEEDICVYQCLCPADYLASPPIPFEKGVGSQKGLCQAYQDGPCGNSNDHCLPGMVCQEGKCKCPYGTHQYFDKERKQCVTFPGGPCVPGDHASCASSAYCVPITLNSTDYHCQCSEISVENEKGECLFPLDFNEPCPTSDKVLGTTCDPKANLVCINGRCGCKNKLQVYDEKTQRCQGLVGARCSPEKEETSCIAGAICSTKEALRGTRLASHKKGICQCKDENTVMKNRRCPV